MKKFLASVLAVAALTTPVFAGEEKVKRWRSFDSVGCMMLRECTEDVERIKNWSDLGPEYALAGSELDGIIAALDKIGAGIFVADEKYFAMKMRGVYDVRLNNIFLNKFYLNQPTKMIQVIRHEAWHTAQDCMAGTLDNTFTALIFPEKDVPDWIRRGAERTYPKNVLPFEAEAMWAMYVEEKTKDALEVCAGPLKMWEHYTPTPLTGEWLKEKGFMEEG